MIMDGRGVNKNGSVQTLDAVRRRLKHLHDTQGMPWRKIASRREYEGIPHGTLWSIAHGREPVDAEQRRALGLPPKTVPVEPCADCGEVHERLHTCEEDRQRNKRTAANGYFRRAVWIHEDDMPLFDALLARHGVRNLQELIDNHMIYRRRLDDERRND